MSRLALGVFLTAGSILCSQSAKAFELPTPASIVGDVLDRMEASVNRMKAVTLSNTNIVTGNAFELASALVSQVSFNLEKERQKTISDIGAQRYAAMRDLSELLNRLEKNENILLPKTQARLEQIGFDLAPWKSFFAFMLTGVDNPTLIVSDAPQNGSTFWSRLWLGRPSV